jgi:hypothetical protein
VVAEVVVYERATLNPAPRWSYFFFLSSSGKEFEEPGWVGTFGKYSTSADINSQCVELQSVRAASRVSSLPAIARNV